jgi:8-oxo-dGTP pyrophosphatase MutT (NUDIX family)
MTAAFPHATAPTATNATNATTGPEASPALVPPSVALTTSLTNWKPVSAAQMLLKDEYLDFIRRVDAPLERSGGPEHITASCFVFTPDLAKVLLCFHKKGQFWVQLGGHVETADSSVALGALREAREEGGIADLTSLGSDPVDLNRHGLGSSFGSCRVHWDIGYAAIASPDAIPVTSDESEDVAWWPVDALPQNVPPMFAERLHTVLVQTALVQTALEQSRATTAR